MGKTRWLRIQEIFDEVVDLPAAERAEALVRKCREDPELRREVESLLEHASADAVQRVLTAATEEVSKPLIGNREVVGPYRLVRRIGEGGMGAVWLAERVDEEFEQRVAVKIVRTAAFDDRTLARFRAERQILAQLNHPNIARLLDGGTTDTGVPYLVMEYVEGVPIDEYCDANRLSIRDRLALFRKVCAAVESAHRKLVVHRDLKPSNILVTTGGEPKLLDFGIAKLLESEMGRPTAVTVAGDRVMTPEYASPEQVLGEPVSTATDVYALGLLLYELLTGRRAHRVTSNRRADVERAVCETDPRRPSAVATEEVPEKASGTGSSTPATIGRARRLEPAQLRKALTGDLDNIVLMALRKPPEQRYASVAELSEDVRRHLDGLPVQAYGDSFAYRVRKFARRHSLALVAGAGLLVLVGGLIAYYTARLSVERDRARREAEKATQTAQFLRSLFEVTDPDVRRGRSLTAEDLLDAGAEKIRNEVTLETETRIEMLGLLGDIYRRLASFDRSRELLTDAVAAGRSSFGDRSSEVGGLLLALGRALHDGGDPAAAVPVLEEALTIHEKTSGMESLQVAEVLNHLAISSVNSGESIDAEPMVRRALDIMTTAYGPDDHRIADTVNQLGTMAWGRGDFSEAERHYRRVLELRESVLGEEHTKVGDALQSIAVALMLQGREDEALPLYERAGAVYLKLVGSDHPSYAGVLEGMAALHGRRGRHAQAEDVYREILSIHQSPTGGNPLAAAITWANLGRVARHQGRFDDAIAWGRESLGILAGIQNPRTLAWATGTLAETYAAADRLAEAAELFERAITVREQALDPNHPSLAAPLLQLAEVNQRLGRSSEARLQLKRSVALMEASSGDDDLSLAIGRARLAELTAAAVGCPAATDLVRASLPVLRAELPAADPDRLRAEAVAESCATG